MGNNAAQEALNQGQNYLNNHYDYNSAITWFTRASELYEPITDPAQQQSKAQVWLGLAMAYHHVGQHVLRDQYLAKAQVLLQIPDNLASYTAANNFTTAAIDYCVVHGYRLYIYYEQCQKAAGAIDQQKAHLCAARDSFLKSIEIAVILKITPASLAHAYQGLGTVFEFLSGCEQTCANAPAAEQSAQQSVISFEKALALRMTLLGDRHPHVARSYHKLARSYVKLAKLLHAADQQKQLLTRAAACYQEALAIFAQNNIAPTQAKYRELREEYEKFQQDIFA